MPLPIMRARKTTKRLSDVRKADVLRYPRQDGKLQVTIGYGHDEDARQRSGGLQRILISAQHRYGPDAARYVAKNVVSAGLADRCELQVAYAIRVARPVSSEIECFDTETVPLARIEELVREHFDLRPAAIIRDLDLLRPIYAKTAAYGHFGRELPEFTWEKTNRADALKQAAGA